MKAAVVREANNLVIQDVGMPQIGDYQCLCETLYGAICPGTDSHICQMHAPFCEWITLPAILGHESIGRVVEVGAKVCNLKAGDLVTRVGHPGADGINSGWGGFAEYGIACDWRAMQADGLDTSEWKSHDVNQVLPEGFDPAASTMFITWRETLSYVQRIGVGPGAAVLIIGSGANGLAMVNHSVNLGAEPVVMIGSTGRAEKAAKVGCTAYIDYKADDARAQALAMNASGFDVAVDVVGSPATAGLAHACVADGGTLGIYGKDDVSSISLDTEAGFGTFTFYAGRYDEGETHAQVCDLVGAGKLDASVWLDLEHPFALEDINDAFVAIKSRSQLKPLIRILG